MLRTRFSSLETWVLTTWVVCILVEVTRIVERRPETMPKIAVYSTSSMRVKPVCDFSPDSFSLFFEERLRYLI